MGAFIADGIRLMFGGATVPTVEQTPDLPAVPRPTLSEAAELLFRCVSDTHFSPLYYGDPDLYREIWNFVVRAR